MQINGASHVSFSVRDLGGSAVWYQEVFGAETMLDEPGGERSAVVLRLPNTDLLIGLTEFAENDGSAFDPARTGLDHAAFTVESRSALEDCAAELDERGIAHSGVIDIPPGAILNLKDPDGIALALMWRR